MVSQLGKVVIEVKKMVQIQGEEKELKYEFIMPMGTPYGEAYDAAHEVLREILTMADNAAKQAERQIVSDKETLNQTTEPN